MRVMDEARVPAGATGKDGGNLMGCEECGDVSAGSGEGSPAYQPPVCTGRPPASCGEESLVGAGKTVISTAEDPVEMCAKSRYEQVV